MRSEKLLDALGQIDERYILEAAPKDKKERKNEMKNNKTAKIFRKPAAAAAAIVLCISLTGVTAMAAATGTLQGFFKDIFDWNGAVVGTTYEQASDEIELSGIVVTDQLMVELVMLYPEKIPYSEFELLGIQSYKIVDANNNVIAEGDDSAVGKVADGKTSVEINLEHVPSGDYKLVVTELTGQKKAEQPLVLKGYWECGFRK